jgi:hypothetical protein
MNPPTLRVQPGEICVMETNDRFATYEGPHSSPEAMEILKTMAGPGGDVSVELVSLANPLELVE